MNWLQRKASAWLGLEAWSRQDGNNFRTNRVTLADFQDGSAAGATGVLQLSTANACVQLLAGTISSLPLMLFRQDKAGNRTVASDHALYRVLHDSPNADQTTIDFWGFICACLELHGNSYCEIARGAAGRVTALSPPIPPEAMQVRRLSSGDLEYKWRENARQRVETQDTVLHIRGFGGGPLGGLSTLALGRRTFGMAAAIDTATRATFANGIQSNGVFSSKRQLDAEQMKLARSIIDEKYVGAVQTGRPLVLNSDMEYTPLTINPDDAQMLQSRAFSVEEICRMFQVPPHMVGHTEKTTSWGTGLEQQTLGFQKFTLRPRLKRIEMALEKQLLTPADRAEGITIEFNLEGLLRADSKARSEYYAKMTGIGVMTINEVRALENLPAQAGGDVPRIQMQNTPIDSEAQDALPPPENGA